MPRKPTPLEEEEQSSLFEWTTLMAARYPALNLLHAIPNGGLRSKSEAARMQKAGVMRGVPDLCLPVPRGEKHGLYIEMKRRSGGVVSVEQQWWIDKLRLMGYRAEVCHGWDEARDVLADYLGITRTWT